MGEEKAKKGDGEKKKDGGKDGSAPIVLKTDLHCEGCAMKVKKAIRGLEGTVDNNFSFYACSSKIRKFL
jgi:hypothetical protein